MIYSAKRGICAVPPYCALNASCGIFENHGSQIHSYPHSRRGRIHCGRVSLASRVCVSRKTREEALKNIQEAIEGIIEVRKSQHLSIPSPDIVEISVAT